MTKKELHIAQYLHGVYTRADQIGDHLDPKRERKNDRAAHFDNIGAQAMNAFRHLTGKSPSQVRMQELNTGTPAPWTKKVRGWTWGQE